MIYLFTYKNGKRALGLSNMNRGIAIKAGNQVVYPILVSPSSQNASNVRVKVNNEIKSMVYVPSMIIPCVLKGKSGDTYTSPSGITWLETFYTRCFYDNKYGEYVAQSDYGQNYVVTSAPAKIAFSNDGKNWTEVGINFKSAIASTKEGIFVFWPYYTYEEPYGYDMTYHLKGQLFYKDESGVHNETRFDLILAQSFSGEESQRDYEIATDGESVILLHYYFQYKFNNIWYIADKLWYINVSTNAVIEIISESRYHDENRVKDLWYNHKLKKFFYTVRDSNYNLITYSSSDGIHFSREQGTPYRSYGNLNGHEIFENGLSDDGVTISKSYTHMPNAYDPIDGKYIRIFVGWTLQGQSYFEVYESTNLTSWTKVMTENTPTRIAPTELKIVNCDGYASVKGF